MIKIFLYSIIIIAASAVYYGCGCACGEVQQADIPASVLEKADQVIISKTGNDFFEEYISIDLKRSRQIPPDYYLVYRMIIPDKPFVNETIVFTVDARGKLNKEFSISGIPDCMNGDCEFSINEQKAISIAESKVEKGIKEWKTSFTWNEKHKKYVWQIITTLSASENSEGERSSGREIIIDANSGEILELNDWHVR